MAQFIAFDPKTEVCGEAYTTVIASMPLIKRTITQMMKKYGLDNAEKWSPMQAYLDLFREINDKIGPLTLYQIGLNVPENVPFPDAITTIEHALQSIQLAYEQNHRGGKIGSYTYIKTGEENAKMVCENPYPCDFDNGLIYAFVRRIAPKGSIINVTHAEETPCRKNGADSCTYLVSWHLPREK